MKRFVKAGAFLVLGCMGNAAGANPLLLMNSQVSVAMMTFVSSGHCISYGYDVNGNRLTQVSSNFSSSSGAVWGSASYGCFFWTP